MNSLKRSLLASSMMVICAGYGRAQQVTVSNGGSYSLSNNLTTSGVDAFAISNDPRSVSSVSGTEITITGAGSVDATGDNAHGVYLGSRPASGEASLVDNAITNSGVVNTAGPFAQGVYLRAESLADTAKILGNEVINYGTIKTEGGRAHGIHLSAMSRHNTSVISDNSITNSGIIEAESILTHGIYLYASSRDSPMISNNTITNSGVIDLSGLNSGGIKLHALSYNNAEVSHNLIANSGAIKTGGEFSHGILLLAASDLGAAENVGNAIANSGAIETDGNYANGISVYARTRNYSPTPYIGAAIGDNTITNSGSIKTTGERANGLSVYAVSLTGVVISNNKITNFGAIETEGQSSRGIGVYVRSEGIAKIVGNLITNSGAIETAKDEAFGVFLRVWSATDPPIDGPLTAEISGGNRIINSGTVKTGGSGAHGIYLLVYSMFDSAAIAGNVITNTGTVSTTGGGADGLRMTGSGYRDDLIISRNIIANSGTLISAYGNAIDISAGSGNTLSLQAPSFIGGLMKLGRNDTVELVSGASHSKLWTFNMPRGCNDAAVQAICTPAISTAAEATFNTSGSVPWFHGTQGEYTSYATFDATGVAGRGQVLGDMARMNSGFMQQGLSSLEATTLDYRFWFAGNDSQQTYEGSGNSLDQDVILSGGAIGAAMRLRDNTMLGGMLALNHASLTADSHNETSQDNTTEGYAGGLFLRHIQSGFTFDGGLNLGWGKTSTKRFVNDNLADNGAVGGGTSGTSNATLGNSNAKGDYEAWWFSPEVAAAYEFAIADGASLTPSARLRYALEAAPSYSEDMTNDRVADTEASGAAKVYSYTTGVFEADLAVEAAKAFEWGRAGISGGYIIRQMTGDGDVTVTMLGESLDVPVDASNFYAPYVAADLRWDITEQFDLRVDGRAVFANGDVGLGAMASISGSF